MASKEALRKALSHWPADPLRPTAQLGAVLTARLHPPTTMTTSASASASAATLPPQQQNAALGLLANKFSSKYALRADKSLSGPGGIMAPRSNPEYYDALVRDLAEVPTRTWAQRMALRLKGMVRWS